MMRTVDLLPTLCAPQAAVIWTRHRRPPDVTPGVRRRFAESGFEEVAFHAPEGTMFGVGVHRLTGPPRPFRDDVRLFDFVGYRVLDDACSQCGFQYAIGRAEITPWLRSDAHGSLRNSGDSTPPRFGSGPSPRSGHRSNTRVTCATSCASRPSASSSRKRK